ncbi:MAG: hypothetical protein ACREOI_28975 [bacterium]
MVMLIKNKTETQTTVSLFRKMSVVEAEKTLAASSVQPAIKGTHPVKHFSTSLEKTRAFHNKAVLGTETIIEFQLYGSIFEELIKNAVPQKGASRFLDKVQISIEGLTAEEIAAGHVNVGIPPGLLEAFNKAILSVKEVK